MGISPVGTCTEFPLDCLNGNEPTTPTVAFSRQKNDIIFVAMNNYKKRVVDEIISCGRRLGSHYPQYCMLMHEVL